jgi:glycosyltransferase involved in cell wall biosynthesis
MKKKIISNISKIKLSIIIPIYNSEKYLSKCLKSVCNQHAKDIEVILIDDNSSDSSTTIVKKYKNKFKFIKAIFFKKNKGVSFCRNTGIKHSTGKYLYFIDSDDELISNSLKNVLNEIYKFPEKELFILNYFKKISKNEKIIYDQVKDIRFKKIAQNSNKNSLISYCRKIPPILTSWQFIFKKKFLIDNKLYYKNIHTSEDWEFIPKTFCLAKNFKIISKPVYIWRISRINSLGKHTGFLTAVSCIQIIFWLGKFIIEKKEKLKKKEINILIKILDLAYTKFWLNTLCLNSSNLFRLSKNLIKFRYLFKKLSLYKIIKLKYFLLNKIKIKKNIITFVKKKNYLIKNLANKIGQKDAIIFCAGAYTDIISQMFFNNGVNIKYIIDNNVNYSGQKLNNILILEPKYLEKNVKKFLNHKILICNKNLQVIRTINQQLLKIGIPNKNIFNISNI